MLVYSDAQIADIKNRADLAKVAQELGAVLRKSGGHLIGSCPMCGGGKKHGRPTRFSIKGDVWGCAACKCGGDVIELVRRAKGCSFTQALELLGGARLLTPEEEQELKRRRADAEREREAANEAYRLKELNRALSIWSHAHVVSDRGVVTRYLAARGISLPRSAIVRETADEPYFHGETVLPNGKKMPRRIHNGPAMVAAFIDNAGAQVGVHLTWLERDGSSKAKICDPETGEVLPPKKMRGSKKGCHLVLRQGAVIFRLFIAEGIETVLSVAVALHKQGKLLPSDAFWAAGDLGNLGGPAADSVLHSHLLNDKGHPLKIPGPVPDPNDKRFIHIPDSVTTLVLLGDGDSEKELTDHAMARAKTRYAKPGRVVAIAMADAGGDFNDMVKASPGEEGALAASCKAKVDEVEA